MISKSLEETKKIALDFAARMRPHSGGATVVALSGDLGSGKTTFTKALASAFGIHEDDITSPTFVIEKRFDIGNQHHFHKFIHIDAYRIEDTKEVAKLGWKESFADHTNLIVIEWPENLGGELPKNAIKISFKFIDENTREIVFN